MREKFEQEDWANKSSKVEEKDGKTLYYATRDYIGKLSPAEPSEFSTGITIVVEDKKIIEYTLYKTGINGFVYPRNNTDKRFLEDLSIVIKYFLEDYSKEYERELTELLNATLAV